MNDPTPEVEALFRSMLLQRSGEERMRMACSMFDTAKALASASIRETQPDISDIDLRRVLFLRFYGHEFSPRNVNTSWPPFHAQPRNPNSYDCWA
jgi:hypothetical protein